MYRYGGLGQPNANNLGLEEMGDALPPVNLGSGKTAIAGTLLDLRSVHLTN